MFETFAIAFVLAVVLIRLLMPVAVHAGLVDLPTVRKRHSGQIPMVGGLAVYATLLALCLIFPFWRERNGAWLIALGVPLLLVGLADDRWNLSPAKRFLVEACCAIFAVLYCGIRIHDIGSLIPGIGGSLLLLSIPMSVVGIVGGINAINMTDGIDGLAGGLAMLTFSALSLLALPVNLAVALQLISFVAVMLGFLVFNSRFFGRKHAAIFMGDGGVTFIGFAIVWYLISLSQGPDAVIRPVSALWLFAVPLLDTMTIMSRRIAHGQSPYAADREHLHHILMLAGFGDKRTVLIILLSHLVFILFGVAAIALQVPDWISFWLFVTVFAAYHFSMSHAWRLMKRLKSFREWAGFEDRRNEDRDAAGRRTGLTTMASGLEPSGRDRRKKTDRRNNHVD